MTTFEKAMLILGALAFIVILWIIFIVWYTYDMIKVIA